MYLIVDSNSISDLHICPTIQTMYNVQALSLRRHAVVN